MTDELESLGLQIPEILLPRDGTDLTRWAVVAADQYTSQRDYWERVDATVGDRPSTLRLILPEVYLEDADVADRIGKIQATTREYLSGDVFREPLRQLVYIDRKTSHVPSRKGLIVALDLEHYDYRRGSTTLVRATEKTVEARLPPRVRIREKAAVELPHVMVLIDDPERRVIEPLAQKTAGKTPLYDVELMEGGGRLVGHAVPEEALAEVTEGLRALADPSRFGAKYGISDTSVLLYAMGDGNHSLAAAKAHWENVKATLSESERATHPARHALVELVNVHDEGLAFEPIHRVVFGVAPDSLLERAPAYYAGKGSQCSIETVSDVAEQKKRLEAAWSSRGGAHAVGFVTKTRRGVLTVESPKHNLEVGSLQTFLDDDLQGNADATIDYIHGDDVVESLSSEPERIGFYLPSMDKSDLFKTVIVDGALPRKTFSMGEADEKRFYFEARRIVR